MNLVIWICWSTMPPPISGRRRHPAFHQQGIQIRFETNVYTMFYLCKAALPHASSLAVRSSTSRPSAYDPVDLLAYAATKGAIVTLHKTLADMAIKKGVRVNAVTPRRIRTPLIPSTMPKEKVKQSRARTPRSAGQGSPPNSRPGFRLPGLPRNEPYHRRSARRYRGEAAAMKKLSLWLDSSSSARFSKT